MHARRRRVYDHLMMHPALDQSIALLPALAFWIWGNQLRLSDDAQLAFLSGLAAVSALVLTAAVFFCAMTYQATTSLMTRLRESFADTLLRNWGSIIVGTFMGAIIAVVGLLLVTAQERIALTAGAYALGLLIVKFGRAIAWFYYVATAEALGGSNRPPVRLEDPTFLR